MGSPRDPTRLGVELQLAAVAAALCAGNLAGAAAEILHIDLDFGRAEEPAPDEHTRRHEQPAPVQHPRDLVSRGLSIRQRAALGRGHSRTTADAADRPHLSARSRYT